LEDRQHPDTEDSPESAQDIQSLKAPDAPRDMQHDSGSLIQVKEGTVLPSDATKPPSVDQNGGTHVLVVDDNSINLKVSSDLTLKLFYLS
jgi:hypothetical protein